MATIDVGKLQVTERLPGWHGRYFHTDRMTFAHYEFERDAAIPAHHHSEEEVYLVLEGALEITIAGAVTTLKPGVAAIVPAHAVHSVRALTGGRALIVDSPARPEFR